MTSDFKLNTPVVFIIYNRPEFTLKVKKEIEKANPPKLFVIADGPKSDEGDLQRCNATRNLIDNIKIDGEVFRNFSDVNLGGPIRIPSGLDWVFDKVGSAIILEDDCLPHPSFFRFCEEMLQAFRDDERIMMISGTNVNIEWKSKSQSYHFSYYDGSWGWATWRRAWNNFDYDLSLWKNTEAESRIRDIYITKAQFKERKVIYDQIIEGKRNNWDYKWNFAKARQSGLTIVPSRNLVTNIGFGEFATNTRNPKSILSGLKMVGIEFPLKHNSFIVVDRDYDNIFFNMNRPKIFSRIKISIKKQLKTVRYTSKGKP